MKNTPSVLLTALLSMSLLSGCMLLPKKVEYFQKKVKPLPIASPKAQEHQRQAAQYVAQKTDQVEKAAIEEKASPKILVPAAEAAGASAALTESMGPPEQTWTRDVTNLVQTLHSDQAKLNAKVEAYGKAIQPEVGKKVEGTGKIEVNYFLNLALWIIGPILLGFLIWAGIKAYGMVNPAVGIGANIVGGIPGKALSAVTSEIISGGESFLKSVENSPISSEVKSWITGLFKTSHQVAQSPATSALVSKLTAINPSVSPPSLVAAPPASVSTIASPTMSAATVAVPKGTSLPPSIATEILSWFASLLAPPAPAPVASITPSPASPTASTASPLVVQGMSTSPAPAASPTPIPVRLAVVPVTVQGTTTAPVV